MIKTVASWAIGAWAKLVPIAIIMGAAMLAFFKIRQGGKDAVRAENAEIIARNSQEADRIDARVRDADGSERERLRNKWTAP